MKKQAKAKKLTEVRIGVIGVGNMGTSHISNIERGLIKRARLAAICDIVPSKMDRYGDKYLKFTDSKALIRSGEVDAVMIETPHYDHTTIGIDALTQGVHTLVEKPISVHKADCERLIAAHKDRKVVFSAMFNQRTDPHYIKLREIIQSGQLGEITRVNWIITTWFRPQAYYDGGGWRATWKGEGGGVLLNQNPHNLDMWQWIVGMPSAAYSHMHFGQWHDIVVEDDVTTYMEYPGGATGVFITTTGDAHGTNRFEIQMDKARLIAENNELKVLEFEVSEPEFSKTNTQPFATMPAHEIPVETDGENPQHVGVLNAWADAILRGGNLVARGEEGINGLMLSNAMHLSAFLNKKVELPIDENLYYDELMKRVATSRRKTNVKAVFADTRDSYAGTK